MAREVHIETVPPRPTAVVQRRARQDELSRIVPELCGLVWKAISPQKAEARPGRLVALYRDGAIHLEVGVEILGTFVEPSGSEVVRSELPGGQVARATHIGPYRQLGETHAAIVKAIDAQGLRMAGPSWEIYGHWVEDESQLTTEIYYRVEPKD